MCIISWKNWTISFWGKQWKWAIDWCSSSSEGSVDSETEEEVVQEQSSNKLYETQVLENEDLPDESQQETTPENLIAN